MFFGNIFSVFSLNIKFNSLLREGNEDEPALSLYIAKDETFEIIVFK